MIFKFTILQEVANPAGIAVIHSLFNIGVTVLLAPFAGLLEKLAVKLVRESKEEKEEFNEFQTLDPRFLETPSYALEVCKTLSKKMAEISRDSLLKAMSLFEHYDPVLEKEIIQLEAIVDKYEDALGSYLVNISSKNLTNKDSKAVSLLLHSIGDFERISIILLTLWKQQKKWQKRK
jgi:phosphate:Na+ symporter